MNKIYQPNIEFDYLMFMCPACDSPHAFSKEGWGFNGDFENPTACEHSLGVGETARGNWCHSYMRNGKLEFCSDSQHSLAGQTVEIPEYPEIYK